MNIVYVTFPDEDSCREISQKVVSERLAAGVNFSKINSIFWWQGELNEEAEEAAIFKTREETVENLKSRIQELHPYEIPCIAAIEADANQEFEKWIKKETK